MKIFKNGIIVLLTLIKVMILMPMAIILKFIGFFVVPLALPFGTIHEETRRPNGWVLKTLPKWAWLFDNKIDGCYGDPDGNWAFDDLDSDNFEKAMSFWAQWEWMAWRNGVHGLIDTKLYSADLSKLRNDQNHPGYFGTFDVENRYRPDGTVREGFLCCWIHNRFYFRSEIYYIKQWGNSNKCLRIRLGHKVLPHYDRNFGIVGYTNSFQPSKTILK